MNIKEKLQSIFSDKAETAVDYVGGGGLISGALYANLSNGLHILALVLGVALIGQRLYLNWKNGKSDGG
jgi:hypothetical protein